MVGVASQLEASSVKFAEYLQAYTAASVQLLGRWPSFVPDDAQYAETLEPGSLDVFMIGPLLPEGAERLSVEGAKAGAPGASRDLRSAAQSESASVTEEKLRHGFDQHIDGLPLCTTKPAPCVDSVVKHLQTMDVL